jgi:uncharacterized protein YprB with RNaseH-like and TPR domain
MPALKGRLAKLRELGLKPASSLVAERLEENEPGESPAPQEAAGFLEGWDRIAPGLHIRTTETGYSLPSDAGRGFDTGLFLPKRLSPDPDSRSSAAKPLLSWDGLSFFDLETTGLSGGTGTVAFLAAMGFFAEDSFLVTQAFIDDFPAEPAFLDFVVGFLAERPFLVTYNGASFDLPLLRTRCIMNGLRVPDFGHLDALHPARRLWKRSIGSCSLQDLEAGLFGTPRWNDVPGFLIPRLWLDFSATSASAASVPAMRDAREEALPDMARIAEHNALDVTSLARLSVRMAGILEDPCRLWEGQRADPVRLSLLLLRQDRRKEALEILEEAGLAGDRKALRLAAMMHRRERNLEACARIVAQIQAESIEDHLELAKYYEHLARNNAAALASTENAIRLAEQFPEPVGTSGRQLMEALVRRKSRLERKLARIRARRI